MVLSLMVFILSRPRRCRRRGGLAVSGVVEVEEWEGIEGEVGDAGTRGVTEEIRHNFCLTSLTSFL